MSNDSQNPEKKIIIDEDWKTRVEAEREAEKQDPSVAEKPAGGPQQKIPMPPPTLSFLVSTLYLQGAMALGALPNPVTKKADRQLDQAKHAIDLLAMLQQKTEGNRTQAESEELESALHELRMAYVGLEG
ncbi:MAG: DUF1844 domain-containing protein [Thermoguttaceae bacterium]